MAKKNNKESIRNINRKDLAVALGVLLGAFLLAVTVSTVVDIWHKVRASENTLSVTATGEIYTKPDLAIVSFSAITEAETVAEALSANSEKMNSVIDDVKNRGVSEKDIKTTAFNIYPRYEWREAGKIYPPEGERILAGYEVRQSLEVKIRDMGRIGEMIQGAADRGANQVGNLQFTVDDKEELKKQARSQAIEKAKEKAEELASQLGVSLLRISNFQESAYFPRYFGIEEAMSGGVGGEGAPQIETGENKITVTVTITYDI